MFCRQVRFPSRLCLGLAAIAVGGRAETVELGFGWRPGTVADVQFTGYRSKAAGGVESKQQLKGTYTVQVESHDLGLVVSIDDVHLDVHLRDLDPQPDRELLEAILHLASYPPGCVVNDRGAYLGLTDMHAAQSRVTNLIRAFAPDATETDMAAYHTAVEPFRGEDALRAWAAEAWERDVGFWCDAALAVGDWHTLVSTNTLPVLGDIEVPMNTRFRIARRVACDGDGEADCVELELISEIDEHGIVEALEFLAQAEPQGASSVPPIKHLQQSIEVNAVAEPATLRPHQIRTVRKTTLGMELGGSLRGGTQTESLVRTFTYRPRP